MFQRCTTHSLPRPLYFASCERARSFPHRRRANALGCISHTPFHRTRPGLSHPRLPSPPSQATTAGHMCHPDAGGSVLTRRDFERFDGMVLTLTQYPHANGYGCTREMGAVRDAQATNEVYARHKDLEVVGVSPGKFGGTWFKFWGLERRDRLWRKSGSRDGSQSGHGSPCSRHGTGP